ncbi:MAG: DsbA family protein [Chloroflexota bacterium]
MEPNPEPTSSETPLPIEAQAVSSNLDAPEPVLAEQPADESQKPAGVKDNLLMFLLPLLTFILGIAIGYLVWGKQGADPQQVEAAVQATLAAGPSGAAQGADISQAPPQDVKRYDVPVDDDYVYGSMDAEITIIEFSDFQCPYCQKWYVEVLQPLLEMYPGQIRFVYRDFPLFNIHPEALPAAIAANCAGEQGKYYEFHNSLFDGKYGLNADAYTKYASDLNLDGEQFAACVETQKYSDEVMADYEWATTLGIQSTPTFFINGIPLVGAQPLETFKMVIDWELEGKLPKGD